MAIFPVGSTTNVTIALGISIVSIFQLRPSLSVSSTRDRGPFCTKPVNFPVYLRSEHPDQTKAVNTITRPKKSLPIFLIIELVLAWISRPTVTKIVFENAITFHWKTRKKKTLLHRSHVQVGC